MDDHFTSCRDHVHIKFSSIPTLRTLLNKAGFEIVRCCTVGRVAALESSMIAVAYK